MANLVTLSDLKLALGITTTANDAQLNFLISTASARIISWVNRNFGAEDYVEWYDGGEAVTVRQAPLQSVLRVGYCDGTYLTATYTGTDTQAIVQVMPARKSAAPTMRLTSIAASYAKTQTDITLTDKTISDVITLVGAVSGWALSFNSTAISGKAAWIAPCTGVDAIGGAPIPYAAGELQVMRYDSGSGVIRLVQSSGMWIPDTDANWNGYLSSYNWDYGTSVPTPKVFQGVVVDYRGGEEEVPLDVQQACIEMVQYMFQQAANNSMLLGGESLGEYSYTSARVTNGVAGLLVGLDEMIKSRLAMYTRMPLSI